MGHNALIFLKSLDAQERYVNVIKSPVRLVVRHEGRPAIVTEQRASILKFDPTRRREADGIQQSARTIDGQQESGQQWHRQNWYRGLLFMGHPV